MLLLLLQINFPFFVTPSRIIGWSEQYKSWKMLNARADSELRHSTVFRTIFEIMIGWLRPGLEKHGSNPKFLDNDLKLGRYRVPKLPPVSVKHVCPNSQEKNHHRYHDFKNCSEISAVTLIRI